MATSMDGAIVIARPVEDVFRFVTDPANDPRWQPSVRESHSTPAGSWGAGTKITQRRHFAGLRFKMKWQVLEVESNHLVHSRFGGVMARGEGDYLFEAVAIGTRFRMVVAGRARWWNLPLEPLLRARAKVEVQTSLSRLKSLMEEIG